MTALPAPRPTACPNPARSASSTRVARLAAFGLLVAVTACGRLGLGDDGGGAKPVPGDEQIAYVIEGREISVGELNQRMQEQFLEEFRRQPEDRQFEMRESLIRELVQRHVVETEARKKGLTSEALLEEVTAAAPAVGAADVAAWYKENEARLRGAPLEEVAPLIEERLKSQRRDEAWNAFLQPKLEALDWQMVLAAPRTAVEATRLARGPADARVTLITFSDYQCPYCIRSEQVLAEVLAKYPNDVRLIHRHFPLDQIHPFARPAAEAAMCADEQGRFWDFHDAIFAREGKLDEKSFGEIGAALGLDGEQLATCIAERRFQDYVEADSQAGQAAVVTGTPAYFVNGIPLKGARDARALGQIIDGELARAAAPEAPDAAAHSEVRPEG